MLQKHPVPRPELLFLVLNTVSEATSGTLSLTVQHLSLLRDVMPYHWLPDASQLTSKGDIGHPQRYQVSQGYASTHILSLLVTKKV